VPIRPSVPSEGDDNRDDDRDDRAKDRNGADAEPWSPDWDGEIEMPRTPVTEVRFHADRRFMWVKFVVAVIFVATPLVAGSSVSGIVIGLIVAVGLAIYGLRDVLAPVRLAADADGVTVVSGFAGHRRLAWNDIERVRLDERSRYGGRQALLEIDEGETLHFFSRYDLGMPPTEALDLVLQVRDARS
jgi:Bacterial PH domain